MLPYLREKWSDIGLDPESSDLEAVLIAGERFEISENNKRLERNNRFSKTKREQISSLSTKAVMLRIHDTGRIQLVQQLLYSIEVVK